MKSTQYTLQQGDTLESIAEKHNISVKELLDFHNQHCSITQQIIGVQIPFHITEIKIPLIEKIIEKEETTHNTESEQKARYRCEQTIMVYIGDVMQTSVDTKREFLIERFQEENESFIKTELEENLLNTYPEQMNEAAALISDVELIVCDLLIKINPKTGKIHTVENHEEVKAKWEVYKQAFLDKYNFLRNPSSQQDVKQFVEVFEEQIIKEKNLIEWVNNKMFFELFFDKYLVTNNNLFDPFKRTHFSQLFEGNKIELDFRQDIIGETEDLVRVRKVSEMKDGSYNKEKIEKEYNEKFKTLAQYKFSEYKMSYRENVVYDMKNRWINESEITIIEEVKNNVRLLIDYKLKKIDV